jgi:hypothetical protein
MRYGCRSARVGYQLKRSVCGLLSGLGNAIERPDCAMGTTRGDSGAPGVLESSQSSFLTSGERGVVVESTSVSRCLFFRCLGQPVPDAPTRRLCVSTRISALYPITARGHLPPIPSRTPLQSVQVHRRLSPPAAFTRLTVASPCHARRRPHRSKCLSRTPQAWLHGACSSRYMGGPAQGTTWCLSVCAVNGGATCQGSTRATTNSSRVVTTDGDD